MSYAIAYDKPGTTLRFWLNCFSCGGHIWSLVRSSAARNDDARWNQPPLRFATEADGQAFIASELKGNALARVVAVND